MTTTQIPTSATIERIDSPATDNQNSSSHPGYAPNAALHAIKRHAVDFLNPRELMVYHLNFNNFSKMINAKFSYSSTILYLQMYY